MPPATETEPLIAELRRFDPDRFLITLFAPESQRAACWSLLAFNLEIAKIRETVSQPIMGQIRLQWWREALEEIYSGAPVRRHVVATPLAQAVKDHGIARRHLDAMIDGRERDLDETPIPSIEALQAYAEATSGELLLAMLDIAGAGDHDLEHAASHIGAAWAILGLIRAIPFHAASGKRYIPAELGEFAAQGIRPSPELSEAVSLLAGRVRWNLDVASSAVGGKVPKPALSLALLATLTRHYLRVLDHAGYNPHDPRIQARDRLAVLRLTWASWFRKI